MLHSHLRHADYALVPVIKVPASPRATWRQLLEITNVADWTTLCISADVDEADLGSQDAGAATIVVLFYQLSGTSQIPTYSNTILVGGRTLCVGLTDQRDFYTSSSLDVRLPIIAPFVEILVYFPTNQVDMTALNIGVWTTNDPSYQYANPFPIGYLSDPIAAADSIMGSNNAGNLSTTRGIYVPANTIRVVELGSQTIGKGWFHFKVEEVSGAPITAAEVGTWVCTKAADDNTGNTMDQVIHTFPAGIEQQAGGIPLVAFRQSVAMLNFTGGAARDCVWHWAIYPEFG